MQWTAPNGKTLKLMVGDITRLPARHIVHAPGPRYRDGPHGEAGLLTSCYGTCFDLIQAAAGSLPPPVNER